MRVREGDEQFSFEMDTRIVFGRGASDTLGLHLSEAGIPRRLLIVTDPGVLAAGLVGPVVAQLASSGLDTEVFSQVAQNPRDTDCLLGVQAYREFAAQAVLAIGGGSAMDTAKTIALLAATDGTPADLVDGKRPYKRPAPIVCMPTTAGTGSEVTRSAVITEVSTHRKMTLKHAWLRPRLAILDPLLTLSVPRHVTAATGVDALVHAIEGSTCTKSTPIARAFGDQAMRLILPSLERAVADGSDLNARSRMLEGSLLAGLCFGATDVAAVHCLAEALGGLYDTPHGVANAVFLPVVLRYNAQGEESTHAHLSRVMGFAGTEHSDERAVARLIDGIAAWTARLGIPRLRDLPGVTPSDFDRLAQLAWENGSTPSNIRPIDLSAYRRLLVEAYG